VYVTGNRNSLIALVKAISGNTSAAGTGRKYHHASIAATYPRRTRNNFAGLSFAR
jgi:hypothetical protein